MERSQRVRKDQREFSVRAYDLTARIPLPFRCHFGVRNGPFLSSCTQTHDSTKIAESS
jgi:hypothetical protein